MPSKGTPDINLCCILQFRSVILWIQGMWAFSTILSRKHLPKVLFCLSYRIFPAFQRWQNSWQELAALFGPQHCSELLKESETQHWTKNQHSQWQCKPYMTTIEFLLILWMDSEEKASLFSCLESLEQLVSFQGQPAPKGTTLLSSKNSLPLLSVQQHQ